MSFCHSMPLLASATIPPRPATSGDVTPVARPGRRPVLSLPQRGRCNGGRGCGRSLGGAELMRLILSRPPRPRGLDIHAPRQSRRRGLPGNTGVGVVRGRCAGAGRRFNQMGDGFGAAEQPQGSVVGRLAGEGQIIRRLAAGRHARKPPRNPHASGGFDLAGQPVATGTLGFRNCAWLKRPRARSGCDPPGEPGMDLLPSASKVELRLRDLSPYIIPGQSTSSLAQRARCA